MSKSSSRTARKLLDRGISYQQAGRTTLADECFRNALKVNPRCADALRRRGAIALGARRYREAVGFTSAALALNPDDAETLLSLAESYQTQGDVEKALGYYRRAVELRPDSAEAYRKIGEAEELILGLEAATDAYRRVLALEPDSAEAHCRLGYVLRRRKEYAEALKLYERALTLDPERAETYADLALVHTDIGKNEAAKEAFERALALDPDSSRTALTLSYFHFKSGDVPTAAEWLRRAIKIDPSQHLAHLSMGSMLHIMEDWEGALACYERALALCPCSADTTFYLGLLHLSQGNFALGWEEYEQREEARRLRKMYHEPQWKGEPLDGARIFLHAEQGLGDTLQAVRYVPLVAARGGQVVLAVQTRLHRLLAHTEGAQQVITDGGTVSNLKWQCPLLSLPRAFGSDLNSIPAKVPYVYADPELAEAWRPRMPATSLRVGLVWGGDPKYSQNFRRSIPLELLAPLTHLEGTTFYSLQMGPPAEQIEPLGERVRLIDLQNEQKDFADTAAIVANLDLVITIDTSVAHLAGAMAKPVWILLNNSPDWRWLLKREDSPWYPTARLFRQKSLGNWPEVVSRVERELRALAAAERESRKLKVESRGSKVESRKSKPDTTIGPLGGAASAPLAPAGGRAASKPLTLLPEVRELLKEGIAHQQAGRKEEAEACYRQALEADPHCPQVLLLLGLLAQQTGRHAESIRLMEQSLALNPDDPDTLSSLAESYLAEKQFEAARRSVERVAELLPQSGEAYHRLGKVQERTGEWDAALECYQRAVALEPDSAAIHSSLGRLYEKQNACAEAVECCRRAAVLDPTSSDIYTQLGTALTGLKNYAEAVEALRRALALKPDSAQAVYALGYLFEQKGDFASAVESYQAALKLNPEMEPAQLHLGIVYSQQGDLTQAVQCFERALKQDPDSAEARSFLGLVHLQQGNFRDGLREYEERWRTNHGFRFGRKFRQPGWQGNPLEGSRILLHAEQGMGDTIHFVRYVPEVAARGGKVLLEVQPRLRRLLAQTPGAEQVVRNDEPLPEFDWQCPLASLPLVLGTELHTIPAPIPYVHADPALVEAWRERLRAADGERDGGRPRRVGLVWAGSPSHPYERWRAIPLEQFAPLTHLEGTAFYSLQMGEAAGQLERLGARARLIDLQHEQKDFADTAAIVANLDLVISIDTSVAHLAGALGKPVWILLFKSPDWRWLLEREDSPWYPTARLFRQSKLGEWQDVVARVGEELRRTVTSDK